MCKRVLSHRLVNFKFLIINDKILLSDNTFSISLAPKIYACVRICTNIHTYIYLSMVIGAVSWHGRSGPGQHGRERRVRKG